MKLSGRAFAKSIYSGLILSVAGIINILMESRIAGAFFFAIGLTSIFLLQAYLYTGAVGNTIAVHERGWLPWLLLVLAGNLTGCFIGAGLTLCLASGQDIAMAAFQTWQTKLGQDGIQTLVSSSLCGFLMYTAWKANTRAKEQPPMALFVIVLCVMVFVLARFDHSIANSYLLFVSGSFDIMSILALLLMIAGNTIGAVVPAYIFKDKR